MSNLFDVEEYTPENIKDIFNKIEGYTKTIMLGGRHPRSITYTVSKGELIKTDLLAEPYKPSTVSHIASWGEIWSFVNKYQKDMEEYYETLKR